MCSHPLHPSPLSPPGNLYTLLDPDSQPLSDESLVGIFTDICEGMEYLHANDVIHYDLKPLNLLVDKHKTVKIADFGLSGFRAEALTEQVRRETGDAVGFDLNYCLPP